MLGTLWGASPPSQGLASGNLLFRILSGGASNHRNLQV